jgi:hypothetical protein
VDHRPAQPVDNLVFALMRAVLGSNGPSVESGSQIGIPSIDVVPLRRFLSGDLWQQAVAGTAELEQSNLSASP